MRRLPSWRLWLEENARAVVIAGVIGVIAISATLWGLSRDPCTASNGFPAYWSCFKSACSLDPATQDLCRAKAAAAAKAFHCPEQIRIHRSGAVDYRGQTYLATGDDRERLRALVAEDRKRHAGCRPNFVADPGTDVTTVVGVAQLLGVSKVGFLVEPRND